MEILIPGLILVALMVYASTRIKKSAAKAFESETIETADFVIIKPAGFLVVIGGDPRYAFEAYTREFGEEPAADIRKATAHIIVGSAATSYPDEIVTGERVEQVGDRTYRITEAKRKVGDTDLRVLRKSGEENGRGIVLEIVYLNETTDDFVRDIESMLQSFELK